MKLKAKTPKYISYEGMTDHTIKTKGLLYQFFQITDTHLGHRGAFRSDDFDANVLLKIRRFFEYVNIHEHKADSIVLHTGDLIDSPNFYQDINNDNSGVNFVQLNEILMILRSHGQGSCGDPSKINYLRYLIGNHDIRHGTDPARCLKESPIQMLEDFISDRLTMSNARIPGVHLEMFFKHWKPVMDEEDWTWVDDGLKILCTHEDLACGTRPFKFTQMETYKTDADIVFTSDIHDHQGVNVFNDTIFISPGSASRVASNQKDKKTFFAHVRIYEDGSVETDFIHFLPEADKPDNYWVDVRKVQLKESTKEEMQFDSLEYLKKVLTMEDVASDDDMEEVMVKVAKSMKLTEEEISGLKQV